MNLFWFECVYQPKPKVRPLSEEEARLQFANAFRGKKNYVFIYFFADKFFNLTKVKFRSLTLISILPSGRKGGKTTSLRTSPELLSTGVAASCCEAIMLQEG